VSDRQYDNELRGVLFKNEKKRDERDADYTGSAQVKGQQYFLDAWIKESTKPGGKKFMSLRLKPKMAREHQGAPNNPPSPGSRDGGFADDPF
jgi:hypothetical protein